MAARLSRKSAAFLVRELRNLFQSARQSWSEGNRPWAALLIAAAATTTSLLLHEHSLAPMIWRSGAVSASLPLRSELLRLPMSFFLPTAYLPEWGAVVQLLVVIGLGELMLGRWFTVAIAAIAHVVSTLTARGLIDGGHGKVIGLPLSLAHVLDTGPSAATVAVGVCLLVAIRAHWCTSILCASLAIAALATPGLDGTEHAVALACGVVGGFVRRPFSSVEAGARRHPVSVGIYCSAMTETRASVSGTVEATADEVFAVLIDPRNHVEIDGSGMLEAAPDARVMTAVGDTFVINMDREPLGDLPLGKYRVINTVTRFEPGRAVEWSVGTKEKRANGYVYGWEIDTDASGATICTNYCDWSDSPDSNRAHYPLIPTSMMQGSVNNLVAFMQRRIDS